MIFVREHTQKNLKRTEIDSMSGDEALQECVVSELPFVRLIASTFLAKGFMILVVFIDVYVIKLENAGDRLG